MNLGKAKITKYFLYQHNVNYVVIYEYLEEFRC